VNGIWHEILAGVQRLPTARPSYAIAAVVLYVASLGIVGARWRSFVGMVGGEVRLWRATLATLAGVAAGNLTPSIRLSGEACRIVIGRTGGSVTWRQAAVATVWDRLSEVPPITVLAVMAVLAARHLTSGARSVVFGVSLAGAAIGVAIVLRAIRKSEGLLAAWRDKLALDTVSARAFSAGVGFSSLLWLQDFLRLKCATLAFGVALSPTQTAALSVLAMLGGLAPTMGGVGAVEGGLMSGLIAFGVDFPTAAAVTALERAISFGLSTCAGLIVIALLGGRSLWAGLRTAAIRDQARERAFRAGEA
jgi:uncharacterized membrane protein YbhN (UPF0104 family)